MGQFIRLSAAAVAAAIAGPAFAEGSRFPIWGDEAEARGYILPKPYGLSLSYMDLSNPIQVKSIALDGHPVLEALEINAPDADFDGYNVTLRGDLWVFPFLNVYGIAGYTSGDSVATIESVSCDASSIPGTGNPVQDLINRQACSQVDQLGELVQGQPFALELKGGSYGAGFTLAGGIGNWFALVDTNFTYTDLTIIDGNIQTLVSAPRAGYRWPYEDGSELRLFAGAMYQKVDQTLRGDLADLSLPGNAGDLVAAIAPDGKFKVEQSGTSRWNTVVGGQYSLNRNWEILVEAGFGARRSTFVSLSRRF
ncbi:hypothetical protein FV139_03455 [Parahaliea maris]|uniref:TonB-dependent receptor n=1 Tax=Parahaliea maris TaxID=2716870 RepID=A0A5C9AAC3_9GAMM|nr:hypothetical protein [Parahaliea maris]TXS96547.1 hypothetical protein FV139_03455 [Parahaliea maris]